MKTPEFIMLVGLPGSGKTTWRKSQSQFNSYTVISFDNIIEDISQHHNISYNESYEKYKKGAMWTVNQGLKSSLGFKQNIIVDMTNLSLKSRRKKLSQVPKEYKKICYYIKTPFDISYDRETHDVPKDTYIRMDRSLVEPTINEGFDVVGIIEKYKSVKKDCYIFDIDGTLSNVDHRLHHIRGEGKKNWKSFFEMMGDDPVNKDIRSLFRSLWLSGADIICVTGRSEEYRDVTEKWLKDNKIYPIKLCMRLTKDNSPDTVVKKQIIDSLRRNGANIILAVDDRPTVIRMYRDNGITCLAIQDKEF